jgi:shikimate dehydrogenase
MVARFLYGLIGFPLDHSWSAAYFNEKFRARGMLNREYRLFPLAEISEFPELLTANPELAGLNVTIPYKEKVIHYLSELDETAREIGAVNTIRIERDGANVMTKGFNTDAPAFLATLAGEIPGGPALILGTGGASRAVAWALKMRNIPFLRVSRSKKAPGTLSYADLTESLVHKHLFIINTTPLGMYPDTGSFPSIPYGFLTPRHFLYDLVYNPAETEFLRRGKAMQTGTMNGMRMLIRQAELASAIFPGME